MGFPSGKYLEGDKYSEVLRLLDFEFEKAPPVTTGGASHYYTYYTYYP